MRLIAILMSSTVAMVTPAEAQVAGAATQEGSLRINPTATGDPTLQEIIVTARRREELLRTVPVAISALPAEELQRKQIVTTQDLTFVAPGLTVAPALSRDTPAFVIRGQQRLVSGDGAPAILTYFSDVPLPNDGSIMPTFDIESIQVLKGPQGTLFGRNTTGGAVLVSPKRADYDFGGYVRATYGSFDERTVEGALNVPVVQDHVALRVAGQFARRDGYTKNLSGGPDLDDRHTDAFRATLLIQPTHNLMNTTIFDYYRAREAGAGISIAAAYPLGGPSNGGLARMFPFNTLYDCGRSPACDVDLAVNQQLASGARTVRTNITPYSNRDLWGITNTTVLELSGVTFKNIFGYRNVNIAAARDYDGTPLRINEQISSIHPEQYTNEIQALGNVFGERLDWIVGGFYYKARETGLSGSQVTNYPPFNPVTFAEKYNDSTSRALFAQAGYKLDGIADGLKLNAGFRYTWDEITTCAFTTLVGTGTPAGSTRNCDSRGGNIGNAKSSAPTWTLGLEYRATDRVFFYVTTRRGYRAGGVNRSGLNPALSAFETYKPETVTDVEIGTKTVWKSGGMSGAFNLAAYRSYYNDIQTIALPRPNFDNDNNPLNDPFSLIFNPGKARIQGFEFDTLFSPTRGVELSGFLTYTDARYTNFSIPVVLQAAASYDPNNLIFAYTPKWTGGGAINLFKDLRGNLGKISATFSFFHSASVSFNGRPADPLSNESPYTTANARLYWDGIGGSDVGIGIFARNLFDTTYAAAAGFAVPPLTTSSRIYNEPRIVGVELRLGFGKK